MDYEKFQKEYDEYEGYMKKWRLDLIDETTLLEESKEDRVNSPSHYTKGKVEAIEIIEDAIEDAPSVPTGFLHGQVLKYLLRVWLKDNPLEDLKKAQWYLTRLIETLR